MKHGFPRKNYEIVHLAYFLRGCCQLSTIEHSLSYMGIFASEVAGDIGHTISNYGDQ